MKKLIILMATVICMAAGAAFAGDIYESNKPSYPKVSSEDAATFRATVKPWIFAWWNGDLTKAWQLGEAALKSEPHNFSDFYEFLNDWNATFEKGYYYLESRHLDENSVQLLRKDDAHGQAVFYVVYNYTAQYRDITRKRIISEDHTEHVAFLFDENGNISRIVGVDDRIVDSKITGYSGT
ncbi:MAG: hypothetical protein OEV28_01055 [Nitrospirota bacterium]|nr:hypothetical protein [Nitrospirota bacterium]